MRNLEEFTKSFEASPIDNIMQIRNSYFLASDELLMAKNKIGQEPFSAGIFLGEIKKNNFIPSTNLLDMISVQTQKKIFVNRKTAWLFLCGRDIFGRGIVKSNVTKGIALIQNENDENLGYGEIINDLSLKDKVVIKNLFDKGNFLRRERN